MKSVPLLLTAFAALSTSAVMATQSRPPMSAIVTVTGQDVNEVVPALGTSRIYYTVDDKELWLYDRATKKSTLVNSGEIWEATLSPLGDRIAFSRTSEDGNNYHVWGIPLNPTTGLASGPARRISMSAGDVPAFSADGKMIAFGRDDSVSGQDLTVIPANGGMERIVARFSTGIRDLHWLPDGKTIFFASRDRAVPARGVNQTVYAVQRVATAGGQPETVVRTTGPFGYRVSPDGRLLLTVEGLARDQRYVLSEISGRKLAEFTLPELSGIKNWSGNSTLLTATPLTPSIITTVSLATGRKQRLSDSTAAAIAPRWSDDGRYLAYLQWNGSRLDHVIVNADGSGRKVTAGHHDFPTEPPGPGYQWSPDSRTIKYASDSTLYMMDATTGRERTFGSYANSAWWHDSRSVFFAKLIDSTRSGVRRAIGVVTSDGRERMLREVTVSTNCPGCFRTIGDSLLIFGRNAGTAIASLKNNSAPRLIFPGDTTIRSNPAISPDNRWLVFSTAGHRLPSAARAFDVVRSDLSARHRIDVPANIAMGDDSFVVTRDSRDLLFIGRDTSDRRLGVYRVPLAGGATRKLVTLEGASDNTRRDYSISPNGDAVTYVTIGRPSTRIGEINIANLLRGAPRN